jgi:hypothetical protein
MNGRAELRGFWQFRDVRSFPQFREVRNWATIQCDSRGDLMNGRAELRGFWQFRDVRSFPGVCGTLKGHIGLED